MKNENQERTAKRNLQDHIFSDNLDFRLDASYIISLETGKLIDIEYAEVIIVDFETGEEIFTKNWASVENGLLETYLESLETFYFKGA